MLADGGLFASPARGTARRSMARTAQPAKGPIADAFHCAMARCSGLGHPRIQNPWRGGLPAGVEAKPPAGCR